MPEKKPTVSSEAWYWCETCDNAVHGSNVKFHTAWHLEPENGACRPVITDRTAASSVRIG